MSGLQQKQGLEGGEHVGCSFLAEAVKAKRPKLHVFGHVHTDPKVQKDTHTRAFLDLAGGFGACRTRASSLQTPAQSPARPWRLGAQNLRKRESRAEPGRELFVSGPKGTVSVNAASVSDTQLGMQ